MFNLFNRNRFGFNSGFGSGSGCGCNQMPQQECVVTEPTITKCCEKEFYHEVPQE